MNASCPSLISSLWKAAVISDSHSRRACVKGAYEVPRLVRYATAWSCATRSASTPPRPLPRVKVHRPDVDPYNSCDSTDKAATVRLRAGFIENPSTQDCARLVRSGTSCAAKRRSNEGALCRPEGVTRQVAPWRPGTGKQRGPRYDTRVPVWCRMLFLRDRAPVASWIWDTRETSCERLAAANDARVGLSQKQQDQWPTVLPA